MSAIVTGVRHTAWVELIRLTPGSWRTWRDIRLTALASDPAAFGPVLERERGYTEQDWRTSLLPEQGVRVVARDAGPGAEGSVGLVAAIPHWEDSGVLYLFSMWVRPEARGRGVGAALVGDVLEWAGEHGWPVVRLRVFLDNEVARRLYLRMGFAGEGEHLERRLGGGVPEQAGAPSPATVSFAAADRVER
ncbi:GCN5-related N-acetyltransferase [Actinosynnema mirum DSM 43827]|uniref:GCN5-related N-acetyltransferase n=1 Tax=Actinosynnema mirum (strain ATCC 29888 / DSM 43827 / JCM 3225 / NBRC 14064 / NCIMB 13271 / NRRL B-12336 / IMRU 3971 / 101) TaxID=446462 RepID=C6WC94_ACTMD|nr:GCN5-related N-acetyltransferase [Actinosynnema mirum DSM 43827]